MANAEDGIISGSCGTNATYTFDTETGKLTISGTGAIRELAFSYIIIEGRGQSIKEQKISKSTKKVVIESGITEIGKGAFYECTAEEVIIPDTVTSIGVGVFSSCESLENITAPCTLKDNASIAYAVSNGASVNWSHVFAEGSDTCECGESVIPKPLGANLVLDGTLKVKITFNADIIESDGWTINGNKVSTLEKVCYFEAPAKDFNADIVVKHGEEVVKTFSISSMINTYKNNPETEDIANALEAYCKAAEAYFSDGTVAGNSADRESVKDKIIPNNINMGDDYYGSSLLLKSETVLRHYYTVPTPIRTEKDGYFYEERRVAPNMFSDKSSYSVNDYIYKALTSDETDDNLKNLCVALYNYGEAAEAYIGGAK